MEAVDRKELLEDIKEAIGYLFNAYEDDILDEVTLTSMKKTLKVVLPMVLKKHGIVDIKPSFELVVIDEWPKLKVMFQEEIAKILNEALTGGVAESG